jgi:hypothetical protein
MIDGSWTDAFAKGMAGGGVTPPEEEDEEEDEDELELPLPPPPPPQAPRRSTLNMQKARLDAFFINARLPQRGNATNAEIVLLRFL